MEQAFGARNRVQQAPSFFPLPTLPNIRPLLAREKEAILLSNRREPSYLVDEQILWLQVTVKNLFTVAKRKATE